MLYPAINSVIADLQLRFGDKQKKAAKLRRLIPSNTTSNWEGDFEMLCDALSLYMDLIIEPIEVVKAEYRL